MRSALLTSVMLLAAGCTCGSNPFDASLADNVGESFAACNANEIRFLATKHNVGLVFGPCGANAFSAYRWSPDGLRIYFQLVLSANVMDADAANKRTVTLPIPAPSGPAVWLSPTRLAVPVVSADDHGPLRMVVLEQPQTSDEPDASVTGQLTLHPLPGVAVIEAVQAGAAPDEVWIAGRPAKGAPARVWRFTTDDGSLTPALPWLEGDFTTFTYTPEQDAVALGRDGRVTLHHVDTGELLGAWPHARRGSLHPNGRWLALEHEGAPVSAFHQRAWGEVADAARRREEARAEAFAEKLPAAFDRTVRPPTLSLVDRTRNERFAITAFLGDGFQWYPAAEGWASFFLWGFEGKQYKRNVALVDLGSHLEHVGQGTERFGLERFVPPDQAGEAPPSG